MKLQVTCEKGWTLIELIFTLSILGFIFTLAVPAISNIGEQVERELFLYFLASDLQLAQMEAVSREEEVVVHFFPQVVETVQRTQILRRVFIPKRYLLRTNYIDGRILFRKTGQVQGGTLWLYKGKKRTGQIKIQVSSGRPKVEFFPIC